MSQHFGVNQALVEDQFRRFQQNPSAVEEDWKRFFEQLSEAERAELSENAYAGGLNGARPQLDAAEAHRMELAWRVSRMVSAFRSRGHYFAQIDPLDLINESREGITPEQFGIEAADMDTPVTTDITGFEVATPRELVEHLRSIYCTTVGVELMQIEDYDERQWLLDRLEGQSARAPFTRDQHRWMLERLTDAQELERFLHTQYVGAKRFSLEGLESVIPMLDMVIEYCGRDKVQDVVIGMAHRGRLNVLIHTMQKNLREILSAFNDADGEALIGRGDVKYHLGYSTLRQTSYGEDVYVSLCFNPSHLEFVDPVVVGRSRAKMDARGDKTGGSVLPLMIHGDAAFMGQGVVMETLNLAQLEGYRTGGTLHIVLNNQVGFTTSPSDARSSRYSSDVMRFQRTPVFHVNAEDIDAVMHVTRLAIDYRNQFKKDVTIDLVGYRRYGHNEGDEPRFTQPLMYQVVDNKRTMRDAFADELVKLGEITADEAKHMVEARRKMMMAAFEESQEANDDLMPSLNEQAWEGYVGGPDSEAPVASTAIAADHLRTLLSHVTAIPENMVVHRKVRRIYDQRRAASEPGAKLDWGTAEMLAYASLVNQGHRVRITGQDARRGTFSHRHAYLVDMNTGTRTTLVNSVANEPGFFEIYDSPLSEAAVLGFEYGYSLDAPSSLVVWEAQFGDFANGAQVIIDQFIAAGEDKWGRLTGLAMLLPHGFEGMGPEHSYARLGRFLQLCAEDNMQVCDVTTPAQIFHLLRRQVLRPWRKPLVVMSPKSLLRHKRCVSSLEDLANGEFQTIIGDTGGTEPAATNRVLLCSGRIYYDLEEERENRGASDVHIIRLEQLYPLDHQKLATLLGQYRPGTELVWVQDEPWNMGAWYFIKARLQAIFGDELPIQCVARAESASPATGSTASHKIERAHLLSAAFGGRGE